MSITEKYLAETISSRLNQGLSSLHIKGHRCENPTYLEIQEMLDEIELQLGLSINSFEVNHYSDLIDVLISW